MLHCEQLTNHLESSDSVHEQGRNYVPRQDRQAAEKADEVNQKIVVLLKVHVAALLLLQKGRVDEAAVNELVLVQVCGEREALVHVSGGELGKDRQTRKRPLYEQPVPQSQSDVCQKCSSSCDKQKQN